MEFEISNFSIFSKVLTLLLGESLEIQLLAILYIAFHKEYNAKKNWTHFNTNTQKTSKYESFETLMQNTTR
jgi:hypothetical protein